MIGVLSRTDIAYLNGDKQLAEETVRSILKTMTFLGFFDDSNKLRPTDAQGKARSCLDTLGDVMSDRLKHESHDRDLVVMRHNFVVEDPKTKETWNQTSTFIESGQSHKSGGISIMSKTVGITTAIAARGVLDKKFPQRGVVSPIHPEIYNPILQELERFGIAMVEDSDRPGAGSTRPKL